ncbi:MAG: hypothetical protein GC185_09310 [Alphaproteobacteria bacterium]|nr:hypothetical protein [Alphaproteobacteria bacterium]
MADQSPSNAAFRLPENIDTLARMRDELSDYLNTLERNTDSVNAWLDANRNDVIVGHHQLMRAIVQDKDEQKALAVVKNLGDLAGFVLSMQDFSAMAEKSLGKDSGLQKTIAAISPGIPAKILEELPSLRPPTDEELKAREIERIEPTEEELEAARRKWWNPGSWFGKTEEELKAEADAESQRKIDAIKRHWGLVKTELVALQSERHYYIDSFMDWIADTMQPVEFDKSEAEVARAMDSYQSPQYVIDLAHEDYGKVIHGKALALREQALDYSKTAAFIDEQKIGDFIKILPSLFPETETVETQLAKQLLLKDFGVVSFAEMALEKVKDRKDQLALLETALKLEPAFKLTNEKTEAQIFNRILNEVTAQKDPLDSRALTVTLDKFRPAKGFKDGQTAQITGLAAGGETVFTTLAKRFDSKLPEFKKALADLLRGMQDGSADRRAAQLTGFAEAVREQDDAAMRKVLRGMTAAGDSRDFQALWAMTYPKSSFVEEITKTAKDTAALAGMVDDALSAGLLDELRINTGAAQEKTGAFAKFMEASVLPVQKDFPLAVARKLIAAAYANGGMDGLRRDLARPGGWLERTFAGDMGDAQKTEWTAALLEPFASGIVKSNILNDAAKMAKDPAAAKALKQMEENFAGADVRLDDGKIMTNLDRIANIWYNADAKVMHYTSNGTGHIFMEDVSPVMAKEVLSHIQRKGGFLSEYDGIFKPENIDRIATDRQGSKVTWYRHSGNLNVVGPELDALHARKDFMHETDAANGRTLSVNQKSIALLQPLEDGSWLLVDRYGSVQFLDGKVDIDPQAPLLDLGGTYFNPENASILSLDGDKNRLDFRLESRDFDDLLERAAPGEYFYSVELPGADAFKTLEKAVKKAQGVAAPDDKTLGNMYFNLKKLGYMMFTDERETGFNCHKFGPAKKPGFINTEDEMARSIFAGLAAKSDMITVGSLVTHKDNIDDAYYNVEKGRFYMVVGSDLLQVDCDEKEAYAALKKLSAEEGFAVVGANYVKNPNGAGTVELPADVINLNNATLIFSAPSQDRTFVICDNEKFHISLDEQQSKELMDVIEAQGLEGARKATPKNAAWTQNLADTLNKLPEVSVPLTPVLTLYANASDKTELLSVALQQEKGGFPALPTPQADFSIAAEPSVRLKTGKDFCYPAKRKASAKPPSP